MKIEYFKDVLTNQKSSLSTSMQAYEQYSKRYAKVLIVIVPEQYSNDFRAFCQYNSKSCPIVFESKAGQVDLDKLGNIDIRNDVPYYQILNYGYVAEEIDVLAHHWQDDFVTFALGCSLTLDEFLLDNFISLPHVKENKRPPVYISNIPAQSVGKFQGQMATLMRFIHIEQLESVINITKDFSHLHGQPIHIGNHKDIGIADLSKPFCGEYTSAGSDYIPVFWPSSITALIALANAKIPLAITHKPDHMLVTNLTNEQINRKLITNYCPLAV